MPADHKIGSKSRDVGWYDKPITSVDASVRDLLENYSNYAPSDVVSSVIEMVSNPLHPAKMDSNLYNFIVQGIRLNFEMDQIY